MRQPPNHGPRHISELLPLVILYRWNLQPAGPAELDWIRQFRRAVASRNPARIARVLAAVDKRAKAEARAVERAVRSDEGPAHRGRRGKGQHIATVSPTVRAAAPRSSLGLETDRGSLLAEHAVRL